MTAPEVPNLAGHPFELDAFQLSAIESVDAGRSVLVAAPTGSGKTVVAEHAVARMLRQGLKTFYTTPIKALSNQKFNDLSRVHGASQVGLMTGDRVINPDSPIVVMTTEVLRNMLYAKSRALDELGCVVLDEVHYLQDPYRGAVWEEVIIHCPAVVQFVCLSATVSNARELTLWITSVRGPTDTVIETRRPVELQHHYLVGDRLGADLVIVPTIVDGEPNPHGSEYDSDLHRKVRPRGGPKRRWYTPRRATVVDHLRERRLLPAIYFVFSRAGCDEAASGLLDSGLTLTTREERQLIREITKRHTAGISVADLELLGFDRFRATLEAGIGSHHAGLVPPFKTAVEECFTRGLAKVVFATETLALGVNMPARAVVLDSLSRFRGDGHAQLTPGEFTQLTGRAGRRGLDPVGHAVVLWSPYVGFEQVAHLATSQEYVLRSAFRPTYNMAVNLVGGHDPESARRLLEQSFAQFQSRSRRSELTSARNAKRRELRNAKSARASRRDPERLNRLEHELDVFDRKVRAEDDSLADRFGRMLGILEAWDVLDGWSVTELGAKLQHLYHETDLLIVVSLGEGLFDGLTAQELAGLASVFTYEHRSRVPAPAPWFPTPEVREGFERIEGLHRSLVADEVSSELTPTRAIDATFVALAHGWAAGHDLETVLEDQELSPADFIRNVRRLIDLCGQLSKTASTRETRAAARSAVTALSRDIVVTSEFNADVQVEPADVEQ